MERLFVTQEDRFSFSERYRVSTSTNQPRLACCSTDQRRCASSGLINLRNLQSARAVTAKDVPSPVPQSIMWMIIGSFGRVDPILIISLPL